jgi:hypothetical protein
MRTILALIASAGLVGCVGSVDMPSGGGDDVADPTTGNDGNDNGDNPAGADLSAAKALFDTGVYSTVKAKCTGGACHGETESGGTLTLFVANDAAKGWQTAVNYTAFVGNFTNSAPVLTKIEAGHKNITYLPAEKEKIVAWLSKELELRNNTGPTMPGQDSPSTVVDKLMSQFAGCMKITDFQAANMAGAWANLQSGDGACKRCHTNGGEGFIANENATAMFGVVSTKKMFWLQYFTVDLITNGVAGAKVIPNSVSFAGVCNRQAPHVGHPTFPCTANAGLTALKSFYDKTVANITAGGCPPKPLEN